MMPASNDAGKAGVGRLVHVGVSKDKSLTVATQVNVHSHSWFWQLHLDSSPRRQEPAVFLSSPDLSSSFPEVSGVKVLDKTQTPTVVLGLGLLMPFRFEGYALGCRASLIH